MNASFTDMSGFTVRALKTCLLEARFYRSRLDMQILSWIQLAPSS